ncbi:MULTISPECIES: type II secretion system protein GspC [Thalassotalea]|uniref:Type II secretion system protein GspC n=1 Tax=Thalassotalea castellviae TaxID=3075612 RepID=A0ABU3A2G0_9GAMM|nr:type II secretion system protein GspC [Thalassotalea sp. W431]MDT0603980.1 type II secretion system protein GspC [Thalassotalea sp. W431]
MTELSEQLQKLPQQNIAKVISALLLCYIAYLLAQFTWLVAADNKIASPIIAKYNTSANDNSHDVNVSVISQLNLFGKYSEQKTIEEVKVQDAPETKLRLTLTGTVASDDVTIAAAIIENNGKQETYGIGDKITGTRAVLDSVATDRVLIKQSGRLETLMLDGFDYNKRQTHSVNRTSERKPSRGIVKPSPSNGPQVLDQRDNKILSRTAMQLKSDINNDPGKITDYLKIIPKRENGDIIGYQLMPGKAPEFFQSSGLKSGDVAVQMNGLDLTIPSEAAQALQALKEEQEISLLVDRSGEMTEILFSIQ